MSDQKTLSPDDFSQAQARLREQMKAAPAVKYLTVAEAAKIARMHTDTIRRAYERGELPASRPAHRVLIREDDLRAWIEATPARSSEPHPWAKRPAKRATRRSQNGTMAALRELDRDPAR